MDGVAVVPNLMPVRMLNEYSWCPRFVHLSWGEGQRGQNEYTVEGNQLHKRVDIPAEFETPTGRVVRTAWTLSSESLRLIGRADRVEFDGDDAILVEFKRGKPKNEAEPLWEPELVQVTAFMLLLTEAGVTVRGAEVFFATTRRRVSIPVDRTAMNRVIELRDEVERVLSNPVAPPPLVNSPKCEYCVMAAICMPDEIATIQHATAPSKRIIPHIDNASPLYLTEPGSLLAKEGMRLTISIRGDRQDDVRLIDISSVALFGNASVTAPALTLLLREKIPVVHLSAGGWLNGITTPPQAGFVDLRRRQYSIDSSARLVIAREMIAGKILNSRTMLRRNGRDLAESAVDEMKRLAVRATQAENESTLLGIEGGAARIYFSQFSKMLKHQQDTFDFLRRSRRPPLDPINALLSYCYALLVKDCVVASHLVGFDPGVGVLHHPRFGRPALALDLAEEFRPLIAESTVIGLVNTMEVNESSFIVTPAGVTLTADGRRSVIRAYERRMRASSLHPLFGYRVTYRRALEVQTRLLAAQIMGEVDSYVPFTTR
jgi:CRISP-associated protein Cas1